VKEDRYNQAYSGIIISGDRQRDLVAHAVTFDRATCDPAQGVVTQGIL